MDTHRAVGIGILAVVLALSAALVYFATDGDLTGDIEQAALVPEEERGTIRNYTEDRTGWNSSLP